ncbi:MAG: flagellin [Terracidiphilus sp.]
MALGVLNNLSAIYAENNLNNTSNSLQTVLQQLSSGSRINSGADDAAGLSLVNGLEANQTALTQSKTNATEGVGLLQVADGALSQVTSLLNRAVTLATEASNGTLNSTQESAANQEYSSILAEVNNIGSTTTYNQEQVFDGKDVAIYTGDSSLAGSSIDDLNIRSLSEASVGDTGGAMAYSSGANNVFLNLSTNTANATATDALNGGLSGSTTVDVSYLVKGSDGEQSTATTSISVGGSSNYSNTVTGLIDAINNAGLGLTASFGTQSRAGVTGGGTETGIQISGGLLAAGVDPSSASTSGLFNPNGIPAGELLTKGQTVTVKVGTQTAASVTITSSINNLQELAGQITAHLNGTAGLATASVVTNGDGTQSLSLQDTAGGGALTVTTTVGTGPVIPSFTAATNATNAPVFAVLPGTSVTGNPLTPPTQGSVTFGAAGVNSASDALSVGGSITLTNTNPALGAPALTFIVGTGTNTATTFYTNGNGNTLNGLIQTINSQTPTLGATAGLAAGNAGITVTAATALTGENITASGISLTNANAVIGLYLPEDGGAASAGTPQVTAIDAGAGSLQDDVLTNGGSITLTSAAGGSMTFTATAGQNYADLALAIDGSNLGVTAAWSTANHALLLTSTTNGPNAITVTGGNTLTDAHTATLVGVDAGDAAAHTGTAGAPATNSTAILQLPGSGIITDSGVGASNLTGQIQIENGAGATQTFIMGINTGGAPPAGTYYTGANTVASLVNTITSDAVLGITAIAPGGGSGGIYLEANTPGTGHIISTPGVTTLACAAAITSAAPIAGVTTIPGVDSTVQVGVAGGGLNTSDQLATNGSIQITNGTVTETFTIGTAPQTPPANTTYLAAGTTLSQLASAISGFGTLGVNAVANTNGLVLTSAAFDGNPIVVNSCNIADATQGGSSTDTLGAFANENDTVSGFMTFSVNGASHTVTATPGETVTGLIAQITQNTSTLGVTAQWVPSTNGYGSIELTSNSIGSAGQISAATSTMSDTETTANLNYIGSSAYDLGLAGNIGDSITGQATAAFASDTRAASGTATISYSDGAGVALSGTDLLSQADAQAALTDLNVAITDVAAQDGYIGAQINTLNSISQVMSTQQENVVSAQNAIQATDYASATSNMSKYEILSQTGIAALAQANTVQQEVTKLLQ